MRPTFSLVGLATFGLLALGIVEIGGKVDSSVSAAAAALAAPAPDQDAWFISPMKVRTVAPTSYLATTIKTSFSHMSEDIPKASEGVRAVVAHGAKPKGPTMLVYNGAFAKNMDDEFSVDVGLPIFDGAKGEGDVTVRALPEFKCASVVFGGRLEMLHEAYETLLEAAANAGLEPTGERRERFVMFTGAQADDNIVVIEVGVK